jgi:integrase
MMSPGLHGTSTGASRGCGLRPGCQTSGSDLRHTVVSLLLDLGTPPHVVQAIARHAHVDMTMAIYAHTNLDAMRQALDAIEWEDL